MEKDRQQSCKKHTEKISDDCKRCPVGKEMGSCENNWCGSEKWPREVSLKRWHVS